MGIIVEFGVSGVAGGKRRSKIAKIVRDDIPDIRGKMPEIADDRGRGRRGARLCCAITAQQPTTTTTTAAAGDAMERRPEMRRGQKTDLVRSAPRSQAPSDVTPFKYLRTTTSMKEGRANAACMPPVRPRVHLAGCDVLNGRQRKPKVLHPPCRRSLSTPVIVAVLRRRGGGGVGGGKIPEILAMREGGGERRSGGKSRW